MIGMRSRQAVEVHALSQTMGLACRMSTSSHPSFRLTKAGNKRPYPITQLRQFPRAAFELHFMDQGVELRPELRWMTRAARPLGERVDQVAPLRLGGGSQRHAWSHVV